MRTCILDTNAVHTLCLSHPPEKWAPAWDGLRSGRARLELLERIVSETASRLARGHGRAIVEDAVRLLKGLARTEVHDPDDMDALEAGLLHGQRGRDLSLVDATIVVAAKRHGALLVTHDSSMRDMAEGLGVRVSWLPLEGRRGAGAPDRPVPVARTARRYRYYPPP